MATTIGIARGATQSRINKTARRSYRQTTTASNVIEVKKPHLDTGVGVNSYVAEVAGRLHDRLVDVSSAVFGSLEDRPELRGDAALVELLGTSVEGNVGTLLHALRYDIAVEHVEAPTAALEYARRLAQHGVPVNALVRAYRLGQRRMNDLVFAELRTIDVPEPMRVEVIEAITATMFGYIDWMSQQVVAVYEDERERWLENRNSLRALRVREVLAAKKTIDVDAATTSIRYPLRWHHLGLIMWYPDPGGTEGDDLARLQRFLRELGEAAGAGAGPLFVAADRSCGWGWLPYRAVVADAADVVEKVRRFALTRPDSPSVAIGTMAGGIEGFRRSHREAAEARGVAIVGSGAGRRLSPPRPGLSVVARLGGDVAGTRQWVAAVLGDLARDNENDGRLRETLRVYLACGSATRWPPRNSTCTSTR